MSTVEQARAKRTEENRPVFSRILVGVDGTPAGFEACRQAAWLAEPEAAIEAIAVVHLSDALAAGPDAPRFADQREREASEALAQAVEIMGPQTETRPLNGFVGRSLLHEADRYAATVIALGSHGHRRLTEIVIGGVAGEVLHHAPCTVIIARPPRTPGRFPATIVVGVDGSPEADDALAAAERLADRHGVQLRILAALKGKKIDLEHVRRRSPAVEAVDEHPVEALVAASQEADVVLVGSRRLRGPRALGSISERVAHQAASSVLVVRRRVGLSE